MAADRDEYEPGSNSRWGDDSDESQTSLRAFASGGKPVGQLAVAEFENAANAPRCLDVGAIPQILTRYEQ